MKKRGIRIAGALLALVLCVGMVPSAFAASAYDRPGQKLVALTFDDGPGRYSEDILNTLKSRDAKATFFMNGYNLDQYADPVRRMVSEGHQVGNHTYNHPSLAKSSDAVIRQEVSSLAQKLTEITGLAGTGHTGFYLRPPYGSYNQHVAQVAGVPVVWCTVDSQDWKHKSGDHLVNYVSTQSRNGDIVIMHETVPTTAEAMGRLLDALKAKGFEMVTVEDLFWRRGITAEPGKIYFSAKNTGVDRCAKALYWDESQLDAHWAGAAIAYVREKGIMKGNQYGEFTPNFPLTRGMFVTLLGRMSGVEETPVESGFTDLPSQHYAAPFAAWALETGIMNGLGNGRFGAEHILSRQQMATALARYVQYRGVTEASGPAPVYQDQEDIAAWAKDGVAFCSSLGLLEGSDGLFRPNQDTTRAMGATVIQRLCDYPFP